MAKGKTLQRIDELERNDVEGALNIAKDLLESGDFTEDIAETLAMMQDDPDEYFEKFQKLQNSLQL